MKVDFATFCHAGDVHRLHVPGQFKRQVESNNYQFNNTHILYQNIHFMDYDYLKIREECDFNVSFDFVDDIDYTLEYYGINVNKKQYHSDTDKAHHWKYHVVNHIAVVNSLVNVDYIVFADNDCWMVRQPEDESWIEMGIWVLDNNPAAFIVSPNDGEPERRTQRFSQQMFLARVDEFRNADFNQPGWDGNVNIPGGPMPEYWAMLEGRMELHCRVTGQYRYVLGPEYRYWHFNKLTENDMFETDLSKY
jgi:hypothetical protein